MEVEKRMFVIVNIIVLFVMLISVGLASGLWKSFCIVVLVMVSLLFMNIFSRMWGRWIF